MLCCQTCALVTQQRQIFAIADLYVEMSKTEGKSLFYCPLLPVSWQSIQEHRLNMEMAYTVILMI